MPGTLIANSIGLILSILAFVFYAISTTYATGAVGFYIKAKNGSYDLNKKTSVWLAFLSLVLTAGVGGLVGGFVLAHYLVDLIAYFI